MSIPSVYVLIRIIMEFIISPQVEANLNTFDIRQIAPIEIAYAIDGK